MDNQSLRLSYEKRMSLGCLLLIDCPLEMRFGIDFSEWQITANFKGLKLIPLGIHYIIFSFKSEKYLIKKGLFINFTKDKKNIILKYNKDIDYFFFLEEGIEKSYSIGLDNFDFEKNLGEYPMEQYSNWRDVSELINQEIIERIQNFYKIEDIKENKFSLIDYNYNEIHFKNKLNNYDKSDLFLDIIKKYKIIEDILREYQFTYICFLIGENYESLIQWKNIFVLLISCYNIIDKYVKFFCNFIEILYNQLRLMPEDLFHDIFLDKNNLQRYLIDFVLNENIKSNEIKQRIKLFRQFLEEKYKIKFMSEEERIIELYKSGKIDYYNDENDDLPVLIENINLNL